MIEVRDPNSNAILFKRTPREKKIDELEDKVERLGALIEKLIGADSVDSAPSDVSNNVE